MLNLEDIKTTQKAYAAHNRIHAEYVDARHGARRKAQMQEDHEAIVKHLLDLGGRHLAKGGALDNTLPEEMREPAKLRYLGDHLTFGEGATNEIQVLRTGTFHHPSYGKFIITEETLLAMVKNFREIHPKPPTELVVDYDHLSVDNKDVWQGKAAGWVKGLTQEGPALFASVEWTGEAAQAIKDKLFRFISPEFTLNYAHKESGKKVGPVLISVALTNRPFLEGMEPVVLSDALKGMLCSEETQSKEKPEEKTWYSGHICSTEETDDEDTITPYALKLLPYRDKDGEVDIPRLCDALSSLPQTKLSAEVKAKAKGMLIDAAREAGVDRCSELPNVTKYEWRENIVEKELRELLKLDEETDIMEAVINLKTEAEKAPETDPSELAAIKAKADKSESKLAAMTRDKLVDEALQSGKLTPKMRPWAEAYALKDPDSFKAFIDTAERVGPDLTVNGRDTGDDTIELSESEIKAGEKLGVSKEKLIEQKKAEKEAA